MLSAVQRGENMSENQPEEKERNWDEVKFLLRPEPAAEQLKNTERNGRSDFISNKEPKSALCKREEEGVVGVEVVQKDVYLSTARKEPSESGTT